MLRILLLPKNPRWLTHELFTFLITMFEQAATKRNLHSAAMAKLSHGRNYYSFEKGSGRFDRTETIYDNCRFLIVSVRINELTNRRFRDNRVTFSTVSINTAQLRMEVVIFNVSAFLCRKSCVTLFAIFPIYK